MNIFVKYCEVISLSFSPTSLRSNPKCLLSSFGGKESKEAPFCSLCDYNTLGACLTLCGGVCLGAMLFLSLLLKLYLSVCVCARTCTLSYKSSPICSMLSSAFYGIYLKVGVWKPFLETTQIVISRDFVLGSVFLRSCIWPSSNRGRRDSEGSRKDDLPEPGSSPPCS